MGQESARQEIEIQESETNVELEVAGAKLAGSLMKMGKASGEHSGLVCLMLHGSGPLDRNENMPGQSLDIFNTFADTFAEAGVGSLRYDKRGCGASEGDYARAGHFDLVNDADAWISYLVDSHGYSREQIVLLGHSEGTLIGAELAVRYPDLGGLILICPFIQSVEDTLTSQAKKLQEGVDKLGGIKGICFRALFKLQGGLEASQKRLIEKVKHTEKDAFRVWLRRIEAKSLREMMSLDIADIYRQVKVPSLVVAGAKDLQCDPADVKVIEATLAGPCRSFVIEDLTHILRKDALEHTFFTYDRIMKDPVDAEVLALLTDQFPSKAWTR